MVRDFKQLINGKKLLLVGNSVEMMQMRKDGNLGKWIDSFPGLIVRFGFGLPLTDTIADATGRRTDIWVAGAFRLNMWKSYNKTHLKDATILFNRNRIHLDSSIDLDWENGKRGGGSIMEIPKIEMWNDDQLLDLYEEFGYTPNVNTAVRPSSGFLTILWLIRKMNYYKQLHLIGFDFFAKTTEAKRSPDTKSNPFSWHLPIATGSHPHNANLERAVVLKLKESNQLRWHLLSDLSNESIKYSGWHPQLRKQK